MNGWQSRGAAILMAVVLGACGPTPIPVPRASASPDGLTTIPVPRASASADDLGNGREAVAAFLDLMADPDLTYRVNGELRAGTEDPRGGPAILITSRYDVRGDDYGGSVRVRLRELKWAVDRHVVHVDGTTQLRDGSFIDSSWIEGPQPPRGPGAVRDLTADDLAFAGVTDDGLLEFQVRPWLEGDPLGDWVEIGVVPEDRLPRSDLQSYDTRLVIDEAGTPHRLVTSWTFAVHGGRDRVSGRIVDEFSAFGLYVDLSVQDGFLLTTSHDIIVGVDEDHVVITEPWVETRPEGAEVATLEVAFPEPDRPVMLGIEGAMFFLRSLDVDGTVILDRIVGHPDSTLEIPAGAQTLVAYHRPCDGSCGLLDPPHDICSIEAEIERGGTYRLIVEVQGQERAACTIDGPGASQAGRAMATLTPNS